MNLNNARPQVQLNQDLQMLAHAHDFDHHAVFDIEQRVEGQLFPRLTISDLSMELTIIAAVALVRYTYIFLGTGLTALRRFVPKQRLGS